MSITGCILLASCLYLGPLQPPPNKNHPPEITNYIPTARDVVLAADLQEFQVVYTDEDEEDLLELEVAWYLDDQPQGNGDKMYVYPEDLGDDNESILLVSVTDPDKGVDYHVWFLSKTETN